MVEVDVGLALRHQYGISDASSIRCLGSGHQCVRFNECGFEEEPMGYKQAKLNGGKTSAYRQGASTHQKKKKKKKKLKQKGRKTIF